MIAASQPTGSSAAELAAAFDAVATVRADLVLFERDEPAAPAALATWAASRGRTVLSKYLGDGQHLLTVETRANRHIDVHLRPL